MCYFESFFLIEKPSRVCDEYMHKAQPLFTLSPKFRVRFFKRIDGIDMKRTSKNFILVARRGSLYELLRFWFFLGLRLALKSHTVILARAPFGPV